MGGGESKFKDYASLTKPSNVYHNQLKQMGLERSSIVYALAFFYVY